MLIHVDRFKFIYVDQLRVTKFFNSKYIRPCNHYEVLLLLARELDDLYRLENLSPPAE